MRRSLVLGVLLLAACGGGIEKEDASRLWGDMQRTLDDGRQSQSQALSADADFTHPCFDGGEIRFDGSAELDELAFTAGFAFACTFDACQLADLTADGGVTFAGEDLGWGTGSFTYEGELEISGDVAGLCPIDVQIDSDLAGTAATGTVCGFDVSQL